MKKSQFINFMQAQTGFVHNFTNKQIHDGVNFILDDISNIIAKGQRIEIRGFGSFKSKKWTNRHCRNPKTGESWLKSSTQVRFKPSKMLSKDI